MRRTRPLPLANLHDTGQPRARTGPPRDVATPDHGEGHVFPGSENTPLEAEAPLLGPASPATDPRTPAVERPQARDRLTLRTPGPSPGRAPKVALSTSQLGNQSPATATPSALTVEGRAPWVTAQDPQGVCCPEMPTAANSPVPNIWRDPSTTIVAVVRRVRPRASALPTPLSPATCGVRVPALPGTCHHERVPVHLKQNVKAETQALIPEGRDCTPHPTTARAGPARCSPRELPQFLPPLSPASVTETCSRQPCSCFLRAFYRRPTPQLMSSEQGSPRWNTGHQRESTRTQSRGGLCEKTALQGRWEDIRPSCSEAGPDPSSQESLPGSRDGP
nr:proteoglycan 4-like [Microcebus murinus]